MAKIINGKELALKVKNELKDKCAVFEEKNGRKITLAVVMVGDNPASKVYVKNKITATEYVGMKSLSFYLPKDCTQQQLEILIRELSADNKVDGILVQLPLPKGLDEKRALDLISTEKDVDGFKAENAGKLLLGEECTVACTPSGVIRMLKNENIELEGKNAVVIGRSNIVGKPMAMLLLKENCTVTVCHSKTANLKEICKNADILVCALGKPNFIKAEIVKHGAVVIDVGINRTENGLCGDVNFDEVEKVASYITPVPGGVGPMTIAMLLENTYSCALRRLGCKN